ncbi:HD domain-containing phosphohydrolase [Edwardsiella anguillarum]|uniref:HD domain-containing phosphohydrolase n=1 Tax=Edwardsiella anguillarum TaxID=1821960 RepID=UPI0024B8276B|nr:HD domain-containing phosphohydrolase [Edwardsiella anguillarum]WHQ15770.1 HAMP domain-containing protein [Edwardsiella anguillarum]
MKPPRAIPFYLHIAYLFVGLLLVFSCLILWYQYHASTRLLLRTTYNHYRSVVSETANEMEQAYHSGSLLVELLANQRNEMATQPLADRLQHLPFYVTALRNSPKLAALYTGYDNGTFFLVRRYIPSAEMIRQFDPPAGTAWMVQSQTLSGDGNIAGNYLFYNDNLTLLEQRGVAAYRFDPRTRNWYQMATDPGTLHGTPPYRFASGGLLGITLSARMLKAPGVAGSDIQINGLDAMLQAARITPNSHLVLLNAQGQILASDLGLPGLLTNGQGIAHLPTLADTDNPQLLPLAQLSRMPPLQPVSLDLANGERWEGMLFTFKVLGGETLRLLMASPTAELMASARQDVGRMLRISLLILGLGLIGAIWLAHRASKPLNQLVDEVKKIEEFRFDEPVNVQSNIVEIYRLAKAFGKMKESIDHFMAISQALVGERHQPVLLARILGEMTSQTHAMGGLILLSQQGGLHPVQSRWLDTTTTIDKRHTWVSTAGMSLLQRMQQQQLIRRTIDPPTLAAAFPAFPPVIRPLTLLLLPLRNADQELLGQLILFIDHQHFPVSSRMLAFAQALAGTAAVALNTQRLLDEQKRLLEDFIRIIAGAIDAKSPHTGEHCQRVPVLAKLLAQAACDQKQGPFADFSLSDDEWEALRIAAWLHDCGKVTTPDFVMEKATKLETLYDRIHEVRMRFELLKRDADVAYWQGMAEGDDPTMLAHVRDTLKSQLDEEFAFVAICNRGSESLSPDAIERLRTIALRTWTRTLSDRIGLSADEMQRRQATPESPLPVNELLLADRAEHLLPRHGNEPLEAYRQQGFTMDIPQYQYHRGELHNLTVAHGTLTHEERFKINEHIIQTILMLNQLSFPRHLQQVPDIAGSHHEHIDGSGYPRGLIRSQMSIQACIMAVADIFEALTASDRPYKPAKTLSQTLAIMGEMCRRAHIDVDVFCLFLQSGVYLNYAKRYLRPEQMDRVDITMLINNCRGKPERGTEASSV